MFPLDSNEANGKITICQLTSISVCLSKVRVVILHSSSGPFVVDASKAVDIHILASVFLSINTHRTNMSRKVALVTGSNKGIGFAVVEFLCQKFDGDVILCSRDEKRGEAAVAQLQSKGLQPKLCVLAIDCEKSLTAARDFLVKEYGGLDVLVNNAAIAPLKSDKKNAEIAREVVGINYFATSRVCDILFPILRPGARVVNVSSSAGMLMNLVSEEKRSRLAKPGLTQKDIDNMADEFFQSVEKGTHEQEGWQARELSSIVIDSYAVSKILLTALTKIQQKQFESDDRKDIVVNAVHPGYVDTDMTMHSGPLEPEEGAAPIIKCCLIPPEGQPRGQMVWWDGRVVDWYTDVIHVTEAPRPPKANMMDMMAQKDS